MADSDGKVRIIIDTNADAAAKALDNTSKSFDKTGQSAKNASSVFNSLQQGINQNVEALREMALGGNTTSAEFQRLAAQTREYKRIIDDANNAVNKATGGLANQQSGMNSLIGAGQKLIAGYIGIQAAVKSFHYLLESTQAFRTQERAIISLNTSLANAGIYSDEYSLHLRELASSIQQYSNYGDEAILKAQSVAQAFMGSVPITDQLTKAVVDFAAAMNMDLEQAFTLVGKSIGSSTNALSRYGVELNKNMTDSQKAEAITKQLGERYEGQARNMADATTQLKNATGDLAEAIGGLVNPMIEQMEKRLTSLTVATTKQINALNEWLSSERGILDELSTAWGKYWASRTKTKAGAMNFTVSDEWLQKQRQSGIFATSTAAKTPTIKNKTPIKFRDDFGSSSSSSTAKAKDEYEKLQAAVAKAKREIELMAIAHGTSSQQVQNAFIKYRELNTQLTSIDALFTNEKTKVKENVGAYQELTDKISKLKTELLDLTTQGDTSSDYFNNLKTQYIAAVEQMKNVNKSFSETFKTDFSNITTSIGSGLANAILTPLSEGESYLQRFGQVGINIIQQMGNMAVKYLLEQISLEQTLNAIKAAGAAIKSMFGGFADGGVFENGNVVPFARGGIVNKPTLFPMANGGTGLMGEAGAEAVMPLRRMSNGRLGVEAQSDKSAVQVNIYNQSDAQIQTRQRDNGSMDIIISKVNEALKNERTSSGFRAAYQREDRKGLQAV